MKAAERLDGKFAVATNGATLSAEDVALGYRQLRPAAQGRRHMNSGRGLRPVHHPAERRIPAHGALAVLALHLERIAENVSADSCRNIRHDLGGLKLVQWLGPSGTLRLVSEPPTSAAKRLESQQIAPRPATLTLD